ncbi:aldose 1-epimerase [Pseudomonas songnenensis]|uniref:Aldose 1-epimerase n=1 Tax=Pseudomonas songnenensis TaxID=1176259 RepID=A0ABX9V2A5_9PSED|nr:aldose 1-epimerase [Pseudomonas songnenensis]MCQ4301607.1 aldose 1-epimerase [Pseudomonas songnenensis]RMH99424.1 aldose 1-epimerase [Pseudomonas songnenensis]
MACFDELHLSRAGLQLSVCPALGGAITRFAFEGFDLLRPWDGSEQVRRTGCFVLAPYSNRIAAGRFDFDGSAHHLRRNSADHALPIHGVAWKRAWQLDEQGADHLLLSLAHEPDQGENAAHWPFAFHLSQRLQLLDDGLALELRLHNRDNRPMPAGLGWHPYFPRHAGVELQFAAEAVWLADEQQLPLRQAAIPAGWDFSQLRAVNEPGLDNNFTGWNGQARLRWPERRLSLAIEAGPGLEHLIVYTPPAAQGFLAVEPVSHANAALNRGGEGLEILAPGQTLTRHCRLRLGATSG